MTVRPATGLKWEKVSKVPRLALAEARAYCEGLTLDGGGSQLAGAKELFPLLDPLATEPPRIDLELFPMTGDTQNEGARAWTDTSSGTEWVNRDPRLHPPRSQERRRGCFIASLG